MEQQQEQRWATMMAMLERIADDVRELLDRLVPEEKEKGKWRWRRQRRRWRSQRMRQEWRSRM